MIINDNKTNQNGMLAKEIINILLDNIRSNCRITVSVGFTNYSADDEESYDDWYNRAKDYLIRARENGKNCACWGQDIENLRETSGGNIDIITKFGLDENKEDDMVFLNSLKQIEVCCC